MLDPEIFTKKKVTEDQIKIIYNSVITTAYYLNAQVRTLYELDLLNGDIDQIVKTCRRQSSLAESIIEKQMKVGYDTKLFDSCMVLDYLNDSLRDSFFKYQKKNKKVGTLKFDFGVDK